MVVEGVKDVKDFRLKAIMQGNCGGYFTTNHPKIIL